MTLNEFLKIADEEQTINVLWYNGIVGTCEDLKLALCEEICKYKVSRIYTGKVDTGSGSESAIFVAVEV